MFSGAPGRNGIVSVTTMRSIPELHSLLSAQAARKDTGIPFGAWANAGGYATQIALAQNPTLQKALDSSGASALIRQVLMCPGAIR